MVKTVISDYNVVGTSKCILNQAGGLKAIKITQGRFGTVRTRSFDANRQFVPSESDPEVSAII